MQKKSVKSAKIVKAKAKRDPIRYPKGWNRKRAEALAAHYDNQTDEEAIAEDEAAFESPTSVMMQIPNELVPAVRKRVANAQADLCRHCIADRSGRI